MLFHDRSLGEVSSHDFIEQLLGSLLWESGKFQAEPFKGKLRSLEQANRIVAADWGAGVLRCQAGLPLFAPGKSRERELIV
jgi:hypothetical protein